MAKFLNQLLTIIVLSGVLYGCSVTDEEEPVEYNLNGPIEFMIRGEIHDDIYLEHFETRAEWKKTEFNESIARFFASSRDTINQSDIWKRYMLTITRNNDWPTSGNIGVISLSELQNRETSQFFISLESIYREVLLDEDEDYFLYLDHRFTATGGNVSIISFADQKLMAEFEITFRLDEKRHRDPLRTRHEGPVNNALTILGLFELDLQQNLVQQLSSW